MYLRSERPSICALSARLLLLFALWTGHNRGEAVPLAMTSELMALGEAPTDSDWLATVWRTQHALATNQQLAAGQPSKHGLATNQKAHHGRTQRLRHSPQCDVTRSGATDILRALPLLFLRTLSTFSGRSTPSMHYRRWMDVVRRHRFDGASGTTQKEAASCGPAVTAVTDWWLEIERALSVEDEDGSGRGVPLIGCSSTLSPALYSDHEATALH